MEKQRYNLKDVAKLAGVSLGTASKVINNQYVRPEARLKVEEAMQELDYTPNAIARSLKANSTKTIGIMIPDISSPVVGKVLRGIEKISRDSGYSILLYNTTRNTRLEEDAIQAFMRSQVDGIIYLGNTVGDEIPEGLKRTHVPVVFAMTQYPDKYFSSVTIDNEEAAYHAVTYLCGKGHRRICLLAGEADDPNSGIPRTEGYCRALGEQGISVDPTLIVCGGYRLERGYEDMKRLLGERRDFTAVFAVSDDVAIGAMRAVQEAGLGVPEDLSIVGFDGIEMAEYTFPGLTTVSQPFEKIGEEASRLLVSRMKDGKRGGNLVLPFALQERESVLGLAEETLP